MHEIVSVHKGGGYMYCFTNPPHPRANSHGQYALHRVVAENRLGRYLLPNEVVHHIDEDRYNNTPENLVVMTRDEHARHHAETVEMLDLVCPKCGKEFKEKPNQYRLRKKRNKSGGVYCSRSCGGSPH